MGVVKHKCGYHCVHYTFNNSGIPVIRHTIGDDVKLKSVDGQEITIETQNIFQPRKNLGHYKFPSGTYKTQTDTILKKAMEINNAIAKSGANQNEARIFYDSLWRPAIEYTLSQSFLSDTQLQKIETKLTTLICMCRYNRNTAYGICHGPIELEGAGFDPICASAGSGCILHLLKNWQTPTEDIGKTFRIVVAWTQYQAGPSYPIFQCMNTNLDYVDGRICHAIWKDFDKIQGRIKFTPSYVQQPLQTNNLTIWTVRSLSHVTLPYNKNKFIVFAYI